MKKKSIPDPIISPEILEMAKTWVRAETPPQQAKRCAVCGAYCTPPTGPKPPEELCWVCRRLKISAWRDADQQMPAQE